MLSDLFKIPNIITVGKGGVFGALSDAINYTSTKYPLVSVFSGTASSATLYGQRRINTTTSLNSNLINIPLLARINGANSYFMVTARSATALQTKNPIKTAFVAQSLELFTFDYIGFFITPGTSLLDSPLLIIPNACSIFSIPNTAKILSPAGSNTGIFKIDNSTLTTFFGLNITSRDSSGSTFTFTYSPLLYGELTQHSISNNNIQGGSSDAIYFTQSLHGTMRINDNLFQGQYDVIRSTAHYKLDIFNNTITALSRDTDFDSAASCVAIDSVVDPTSTYPNNINIIGNSLFSESYDDGGSGFSSPCAPIDIRNQTNNSKIIINSNSISSYAGQAGHTNLVAGVACYSVQGVYTPDIVISNNAFNVKRNGGGANVFSISNVNANFSFRSAGNIALTGSVATTSLNVIPAAVF